jgi:hypothetical protein
MKIHWKDIPWKEWLVLIVFVAAAAWIDAHHTKPTPEEACRFTWQPSCLKAPAPNPPG